ncbi:hypothetical protein H0H92_005661 [Tricholoma furcatifolium]|nr:hypothetical protein H0H92_005661 [Tricholoma furcatifolium]
MPNASIQPPSGNQGSPLDSTNPNPHSENIGVSPSIRYDDAGAPFYQDASGRFVPYFGHYPPPPPPLYPPGLPISHAMMPPPTPVPSSSCPAPVIDPELTQLPPLPISSDEDLSDGPTIAKAQGYEASRKVAGSRCKGKGKQRAEPLNSKGKHRASGPDVSNKRKAPQPSSDEEENEPESKRGRPRGAGNYQADDVSMLLDMVEQELPLGQKGWTNISRRYNKWAHRNKRPERTLKSLETKYKQLVKTTMPTGDAYCPPEVKRAHGIEELINERACTRDLDDDEFDGTVKATQPTPHSLIEVADSSDDDIDIEIMNTPYPKVVRSAVVQRPNPITARRNSRVSSLNLVTKLTDTFDSAAIKARDAERAERSFSNTQLLTLSQQNRDLQNVIEGLRSQLSQSQDLVHKAERARDRADMQVEMLKMAIASRPPPDSKHPWEYIAEKRNGHARVATHYPEGGFSTYWVTDSESEKENHVPQASSSRHSHSHRSHPHSCSRSHYRHHYGRSSSPRIRIPPSPDSFQSAMRNLSNIPEPPDHFVTAAGDDNGLSKVSDNTNAHTQVEYGANDDNKGNSN